MPKYKKKIKNLPIFPGNSDSIINDILKKYNLKESNEEFLEKLKKGENSFGGKIAKILVKTCNENISSARIITLIQKELNIDRQKSQDIAEELKEKIIDRVIENTETPVIEKSIITQKTSTSIGRLLLPDKKRVKK